MILVHQNDWAWLWTCNYCQTDEILGQMPSASSIDYSISPVSQHQLYCNEWQSGRMSRILASWHTQYCVRQFYQFL
jgi:hypothetical protein